MSAVSMCSSEAAKRSAAHLARHAKPEFRLCLTRAARMAPPSATRCGSPVPVLVGNVVPRKEARVKVDDPECGPRAVDGRDREAVRRAAKVEVFAELGQALKSAPEVCRWRIERFSTRWGVASRDA